MIKRRETFFPFTADDTHIRGPVTMNTVAVNLEIFYRGQTSFDGMDFQATMDPANELLGLVHQHAI